MDWNPYSCSIPWNDSFRSLTESNETQFLVLSYRIKHISEFFRSWFSPFWNILSHLNVFSDLSLGDFARTLLNPCTPNDFVAARSMFNKSSINLIFKIRIYRLHKKSHCIENMLMMPLHSFGEIISFFKAQNDNLGCNDYRFCWCGNRLSKTLSDQTVLRFKHFSAIIYLNTIRLIYIKPCSTSTFVGFCVQQLLPSQNTAQNNKNKS